MDETRQTPEWVFKQLQSDIKASITKAQDRLTALDDEDRAQGSEWSEIHTKIELLRQYLDLFGYTE